MIIWDTGTSISGEGSITPAGDVAAVVLDTIPGWLSRSGDTPARYYRLGTIGAIANGYRTPGERIIYADQIQTIATPGATSVYWVLEPGVSGTLYRGVDTVSDLPIAARVSQTAAQTLTTGVGVVLTFDTEHFDPWGMHGATNTSRLTVPSPGWYSIGAQVVFTANSTGQRRLVLQVNGATPIAGQAMMALTDSSAHRVNAAAEYWLNAGDYVEAVVTQSSGGNLDTVIASSLASAMWLTRIGG